MTSKKYVSLLTSWLSSNLISSALRKGWVLFLLPFLHTIHNQRLPYATLKNGEAFPRQHSWCPLLNRQNLEEVGGTGVQWRGKEKVQSHLPPDSTPLLYFPCKWQSHPDSCTACRCSVELYFHKFIHPSNI